MRVSYSLWVAMVAFCVGSGCGGGAAATINDVDPVTIPGGGVSSGAVLGELNVTVLDGLTEEVVAGARVQVGEPGEAEPLSGTTDAAGVATLRDSRLVGPQTITVVADGYAPTTWFGANGANVTMQVRLRVEPDPPTAQLSGSIDGWGTLPEPAPGHYRVVYVTYSRTEDFSLPENNLEQPTGAQDRPRNICVYMPPNFTDPCGWELTTRVGPQAVYAFVLDVDMMGTQDRADDVTTLVTYGLETGFDLDSGEQRSDVAVALLDPADLVEVSVDLPASLAGLDEVQVYPHLDLGDEGFLLFTVPPLTPDTPRVDLPALGGVLAEARYELRAVSEPALGDDADGSVVYLRPQDLGDPMVFDSWLPTPTDLQVTDGVYQFTPVSGASMHSAQVEDADGNTVWHILLLDGRTTFTLPEVTPDPFPTGDATFFVTATVFPEFDPQDFIGDVLGDTVTHSARAALLLTE